jgi:magnesium-transporting ATPase (P-type)
MHAHWIVCLLAGRIASRPAAACAAGPAELFSGLAVDESTLTGESVPRQAGAGDQLSAGTFVVEGAAETDVTATGDRTRLAGIAALTGQVRQPPSPLAVRLNRMAGIVGAGHGPQADEQNLMLLGVVGLLDPPRPDAAEAVAACRAAGIRLALITGDHAGTARAIAAQVGLLGAEPLVLNAATCPPTTQPSPS